jgi:hypothetical protein
MGSGQHQSCISPSQLQPLDFRITHAFKHHYRKQFIWKTVPKTNGGLRRDVTYMKLDVLSSMHFIAEACGLITPTTMKNCSVKCGFSTDHANSNDDSAVKFSKDAEDDWHNLQPFGVQSEDYPACGSALKA